KNRFSSLGCLLGRRLEKLQRFAQDGVIGREWPNGWRLPLGCGAVVCRGLLVIAAVAVIERCSAHDFRWHNALIKNRLSVSVVIIRDGQNQRGAVVQGDQFLLRGETEGSLTDQIAAMGHFNGGSKNLSGAGSRAVDQNRDRAFPNNFSGFSR